MAGSAGKMSELDNPFLALFDTSTPPKTVKSDDVKTVKSEDDSDSIYRQHFNDLFESILCVTLNPFNPNEWARTFLK